MRSVCERIQYTGERKNLKDQQQPLTEDEALAMMPALLEECRREYDRAMAFFKQFYAAQQ
jgi:hypothetical protein